MASPQFPNYDQWTQILHAGLIGRAGITSVAPTSGGPVFLSAEALCLDQLSFNASDTALSSWVDSPACIRMAVGTC